MAAPDFSAVRSLPANASASIGTTAEQLKLPVARPSAILLHFATNAGFFAFSESGTYFKVPADAVLEVSLEGVEQLWIKAASSSTTVYASVLG